MILWMEQRGSMESVILITSCSVDLVRFDEEYIIETRVFILTDFQQLNSSSKHQKFTTIIKTDINCLKFFDAGVCYNVRR